MSGYGMNYTSTPRLKSKKKSPHVSPITKSLFPECFFHTISCQGTYCGEGVPGSAIKSANLIAIQLTQSLHKHGDSGNDGDMSQV